jgi:hypothetical protein
LPLHLKHTNCDGFLDYRARQLQSLVLPQLGAKILAQAAGASDAALGIAC